jgi:thiol-disulfide isomerase/thioredoxin
MVFDPFHPLEHRLKIALDPLQRSQGMNIKLIAAVIPAPPKITDGGGAESLLDLGKPAPELAFQRVFPANGAPVRIVDCKGHFVLLHFWGIWCGPCLIDLPRVELAAKLYHDQGLVLSGSTTTKPLQRPSRVFWRRGS